MSYRGEQSSKWFEEHLWKGYSPTATFLCDLGDAVTDRFKRLEKSWAWITDHMGLGNYFSQTHEMSPTRRKVLEIIRGGKYGE